MFKDAQFISCSISTHPLDSSTILYTKTWRSGSSLHALKFYTNWLPTDNSTLLSSLVVNVSNHNIYINFWHTKNFPFSEIYLHSRKIHYIMFILLLLYEPIYTFHQISKSSALVPQIMIIFEKVFSKVKLNWRLFRYALSQHSNFRRSEFDIDMETGIPLNAEKHKPIYKTNKGTTENLSPANVNFEHLSSMCKKKCYFAPYIYYTLAFMC